MSSLRRTIRRRSSLASQHCGRPFRDGDGNPLLEESYGYACGPRPRTKPISSASKHDRLPKSCG